MILVATHAVSKVAVIRRGGYMPKDANRARREHYRQRRVKRQFQPSLHEATKDQAMRNLSPTSTAIRVQWGKSKNLQARRPPASPRSYRDCGGYGL